MKRLPLATVLGMVLCASALGAQAGSPNMTAGSLTRVTLLRINPGQADMFWQDVRQHSLPILEEQKKHGLILGYSVSTKSTADSEDDWSVALFVTYKDWATLDTFSARSDSISRAHYGTVEARAAAAAARLPYAVVVQSLLMRNQTINPWR